MKKSKWLPAGFWDDFDKTFSRLFTGANLVALGFSGLYYAIYWILERIYSSLFGGLLGVYSIIGNGSLKGELLQRWLPAGDAFFPQYVVSFCDWACCRVLEFRYRTACE